MAAHDLTSVRFLSSLHTRIMALRGCGRFTISERIAILLAAWDSLTPDEQAKLVLATEPRKTRLETTNA